MDKVVVDWRGSINGKGYDAGKNLSAYYKIYNSISAW